MRGSSGRLRLAALLPMKAHSERIPGKNFRALCGKPLFRWMLDTLLSLPEVELVAIDTDGRDLLRAAGLEESARVAILERPAELCGDFVSMNRILEQDLGRIDADVYLMTHVTNPLLGADTIRRALAAFESARKDGSADSLFAVNRFQSRFYLQDGTPLNHDPSRLVRTQDVEPWFEENSNLYLFTRASFAATRARIGAQPLLFETPRAESIDIDDAEGWELAERLAGAARRGAA